MKTLYLHIGLSKTGTSALQVTFAQNREFLKAHNIHYPAWGIEEALNGQISSGNGLKIAQFLNSDLNFLLPINNIKAEIEQELSLNFGIVLFSTEFFFDFDAQKMTLLKEIANSKDYEIKIIAYVRDFVPLYESLYGQSVKRGLCTESYKEYLSTHIAFQYDNIKPYLDFFGKDFVIIKKYSETFDTSTLITSFLDIFEIDFDINKLKLPDIINANLAFADLEIMRKLNSHLNYEQCQWMSDYLLENLKQGQPKLKIADAEDVQFILKKHHQEIIELNSLITQGELLSLDEVRNLGCQCTEEEKNNRLVELMAQFIVQLSDAQIAKKLAEAQPKIPLLFPVGHFYSPIADPADIKARENTLWKPTNSIMGVDLNVSKQTELLKQLKPYIASINYPIESNGDNKTYFYKNDQFPVLDAQFLYAAICHFQPKNVIEVGSGYSSLITADVNRRIFKNSINFTCIEPYPRQFLRDGIEGISQLIIKKVEDVELSFFERLEAHDILFIDSSHVSKVGSDVNFLFFEVLPRLKKGVLVHIHDIFLPDEYPKVWMIDQGRNWNEQYLLRAFLQFNSEWEVIWSAYFMATRHFELTKDAFPCFPELGGGGSLWLTRI